MKAWFLRFSIRDQVALLALVAAVLIYVLWMFLVLPQGRARQEMRARNAATAEQLQRVDQMASEISARRASGDSGSAVQGSLTAVLNSSADRNELRISRLQPNSRGAVQLRFESVELESLLRWLLEVESRLGLRVEELSISQTANPGIVSASLRVAAAS